MTHIKNKCYFNIFSWMKCICSLCSNSGQMRLSLSHWWWVGIDLGETWHKHYKDVIMGAMASQISSLTIFYSTVYSGADQSKHQSSVSLALVWGIHRWLVNSPHKWPVTRKMFPFLDVIMKQKTTDHWIIDNKPVNKVCDSICHH